MQNLGSFAVNEIYCGDSAVLLKQLPAECIDLTVTSPPYDNLRTYNGYTFDFETIAQELYRVTKRGGVVVWVVGDATVNGSETLTSFKQALFFRECGFNVHDTMIYQTDKPPMNDNRYQAEFEYMFVLSKGKPKTVNLILENTLNPGGKRGTYRQANGDLKNAFHKKPTGDKKVRGCIWYYPSGGSDFGHPAVYPEKLARDHILSWSNEGDMVLDCFAGSGTTLKMAKILNRNYIGFEISQDYCDLARKRVLATPVPLFQNTTHTTQEKLSGQNELFRFPTDEDKPVSRQ